MDVFTLCIVVVGALLRLVPHIPNFTPVGAVALFGGAGLSKRRAFTVPLLVMALSDYLLLYINPYASPMVDFHKVYPIWALVHPMTLYVWGSFCISGLLGFWLRKHLSVRNVIFISLAGSVQFFLITSFGVWAGGMYSRGINGLIESFMMGLPFFRWTVLGDFFYCGIFFGVYALVQKMVRINSVVSNRSL